MPWTHVLWLIAKVALRVLADELDPAGRRRPRKGASRPKASPSKEAPPQAKKAPPRPSKEAPPQPKKEQARPKKAPSESPKRPPQAKPAAPYAAPQSAESAGWGTTTEPQPVPVLRIETDAGSTVSPLSVIGTRAYIAPRVERERSPGESRRARRSVQLPRSPEMAAAVARMRARASGLPTPVPAEAQDARPPIPAPRRRPPGEPLALTQLAPATLLLLQQGEPITDAAWAA